MAKCPFANWDEITGSVGSYTGGPFKIVHHTTEGTSYAAAKAAYTASKSDPHFTVVGEEVYQHVDTAVAARALKHVSGDIETNRDSAVQIEVVAFAGQPKDPLTLKTVAKLCRWIEGEHDIQQRWPNGLPRWSTNGKDPGGHNRSANIWDTEGGHYGHSQVPENSHWDPGYVPAEVAIITPDAAFDLHQDLAIPSVALALSREQTSSISETAEAITERLIAALGSASMPSGLSRLQRVSVIVVSRDVEVRVVLEGEVDHHAIVPSTTKRRKSLREKRSAKSATRRRG